LMLLLSPIWIVFKCFNAEGSHSSTIWRTIRWSPEWSASFYRQEIRRNYIWLCRASFW
jgi:hypothetical protein